MGIKRKMTSSMLIARARLTGRDGKKIATRGVSVAAALALGLVLSGCGQIGTFSESYTRGYVVPPGALEQIPIGAAQEQVLLVMGTPSTVATVSGEAFYYISQRTEKPIAFMPDHTVDQRVIAVYFDKNRRVERLADYGLKDGKVFDFIGRTTPTGGSEQYYLGYLFNLIK
jgi:outer membrane protein assembly factor BamE (lipoprotein component of BamABCDE complex)